MPAPISGTRILFTPLPAAHFGTGTLAVCQDRLADVAFALGAGDTARSQAGNAEAAIGAVTALRDLVGLTGTLAALGIGSGDYARISADALDDEVLDNTPRIPDAADIAAILTAAPAPPASIAAPALAAA